MEEYFRISPYEGVYILRCDAGVQQELFDELGLLCTGPVIEAAVFRIWDDSDQEPFSIEFDSDNAMFSAYSADRSSLRSMAEMMNRVFNDTDALREVLESEEVQEASNLEKTLAEMSQQTPKLYADLGLKQDEELSPEKIADIFSRLF